MTDGLSRREVVLVGGAGLAASACMPGGANALEVTTKPDKANIAQRSLYTAPCDVHGLDAHMNPVDGTPYTKAFRAPYICVIHINFSEPWKIWINYASFKMNGKYGDDDRLGKAKEVLRERFDTTTADRPARFSELRRHPTHNGSDKLDFRRFGFKSKHELFFFFESTDIELTDKMLVVFTRMSNLHPEIPNDENLSFINAEIVPEEEMEELHAKGRMFRMRNYMRDENGDIDWTKGHSRDYSMNIHFKIKAGTNAWVPMVIDPDTGNGTGHEP